MAKKSEETFAINEVWIIKLLKPVHPKWPLCRKWLLPLPQGTKSLGFVKKE
jgi:hypothetical protein